MRGSGGTGILIKRKLYTNFHVECCFKISENALGVKLTHKLTCESMIIVCIYLPPENSNYAASNEDILNQLTIEMYKHAEVSNIIIGGDFNARIGRECDTNRCDNISMRDIKDVIKNKQVERLLTFVNDVKGCVLNGRITPEKNDFTSVTAHKGKSVVDYFICRQSDLNMVKNMEVVDIVSLIDDNHWEGLVSDVCRPPDHNLLTATVEWSEGVRNNFCGSTLGCKSVKRKHVLRKVDDSYMCSELADRMIPQLLLDLSTTRQQQSDIDSCYDKLASFILSEAESASKPPGVRRKSTTYKPYWDLELAKCWKNMKECERLFRLGKNGAKKQQLHASFKTAQ